MQIEAGPIVNSSSILLKGVASAPYLARLFDAMCISMNKSRSTIER
jgi:hypothetical protein